MNAMKWVLAGALAAGAQTAGIDTSLLKSGNTWVYERDEEERSAGNVYDGFSGITRFAVDSVSYRGDTLRFRVIRKDSLRSKVMYETLPGSGLREYRDTYVVDTVRFSVTPGGISPSPGTHLLFLDGQTFSSTDGRVAYRGDTLRYRQASTGGPGICTWTRSRNLEKVGRTYVGNGHIGCGLTSSSKTWTLVEFKGLAYSEAQLSPVALRGTAARALPPADAGGNLHRGRWIYSDGRREFDLRGRGSAPVDLAPAKP